MNDFIDILKQRGFVHQITDEKALKNKLSQGSCVIYGGFDATAKSLHVGNLMLIMMLYWAQKCGHVPYVLVGGGTTKVGDPSGKEEGRNLLSTEQINKNIESIKSVFDKFIDFKKAKLINNDEWLDNINYLDFLRDVGSHFSINRMLSFDSVKLRLDREQSLSFLEFNYMILQAYDFMTLSKNYDCCLQLGGSDQWGNIVNGVDLTRRMLSKEVYGLTCPLITTSDGKKMGKSVNGAVWLNEDMLSPYDYWQFWRNTTDEDVGKFLKLYTTLPLEIISKLESLKGKELNESKKVLANEATSMIYGKDILKSIHNRVNNLFESKSGDLSSLPVIEIKNGSNIIHAITSSGFAKSNGEARRLIKGNGVKLNDLTIDNPDLIIDYSDKTQKLSVGKKNHIGIKVIYSKLS